MSAPAVSMVALEAEQSVLGSLLLDNSAADRISTPLAAEHFYRDDHRRIYRAITRLIAEGNPADVVTVAAALESTGEAEQCGGLAYLGEIAINTPSAANIRRYAESVVERALAAAADEIAALVADPSISLPEKLQVAQGKVMAVTNAGTCGRYEPQHIRDALMRHTEVIEARREGRVTALVDPDQIDRARLEEALKKRGVQVKAP